MRNRRGTVALLVGLGMSVTAVLWSAAAFSQAYPTRPVKLVVPYAAGGSSDMISRSISRQMSEGLGQQVVVENRGGASGRIAMEAVSRAPGDGYTLLFGTVTGLTMAPSLFPDLPYDPVKSFAPISLLTVMPMLVVVNASVPANTLKELIDLAKANPGKLNYATVGNGSIHHFVGENFKILTGVNIVAVPYQGAAAEVIGMLSGQVQIGFDAIASWQAHNLQSGKIRALAVAGPKRIPSLPSVPTAAEAGLPGFEASAWFGLLAPAGTPAAVINRLNEEARKALAAKDVRELIFTQGLDPAGTSPDEFAALIRDEIARWSRVVKVSGFKAN